MKARLILAAVLVVLVALVASCESRAKVAARDGMYRAIEALEAVSPGQPIPPDLVRELTRTLRVYAAEDAKEPDWLPALGEVVLTTVLAFAGVNFARNRGLPGTRRRRG